MTTCWKCDRATAEALFCPVCGALQKPQAEYYGFFGIDRRLTIDPAGLQKRFYELSRLLHPDRFSRRHPREQEYSLEATSILNDAYRVLREPVARAEYFLKQEGFDIGEQRSKDVPPELLEEVFELNMAIEELRLGDEDARPALQQAALKFSAMREAIDAELEALFLRHDANGSAAPALQEIRNVLNRRRYVLNLVNEVEKELAR